MFYCLLINNEFVWLFVLSYLLNSEFSFYFARVSRETQDYLAHQGLVLKEIRVNR